MSGVAERLKHDAVVIGVGISLDDTLVVDELALGCAADKSGSVKVGDTIIAVNGNKSLTAALAKEPNHAPAPSTCLCHQAVPCHGP